MKVTFHTLGCRVNQYETEALMGAFAARGDEIVPEGEAADLCVVNTCTVTSVADKKSRQFIRRFKKQNPDSVLAVIGCYVQVHPEEAFLLEGVDLVAGTNEKARLPELVDGFLRDRQRRSARLEREDLGAYEEFEAPPLGESRTRAHLKIQEGCNRFCAYCIVPTARGDIRSRDHQSVLAEASRLIDGGCREIVLTGINTALYGAERGDPDGLADLVAELAAQPGDFRIRLSSLEPTVIRPDTARAVLSHPKVCPHLHLSLQSGSDRILAAMNRNYTSADYLELVRALREIHPNFGLTTDIIAGFPGETEADFEESLRVVREAGFAKVHVFKYSPREGTPAASMKDQIPEHVKKDRCRRLEAAGREAAKSFFEKNRGAVWRLLVEEISEDGKTATGYTDNYIRTRLALEEGAAPVQGEFVPVRMTSPGREGMSAIPWKDPLTGKENPNA